jgi:TM2 domain-containing membrane protein YozV
MAKAEVGFIAAFLSPNTALRHHGLSYDLATRTAVRNAREGTVTQQPAGWYPQSGQLRYWDGSQWTSHTAPMVASPPAQQQMRPYSQPYAQPSAQPQDRPMPVPTSTPWPGPAVGVAPKNPGISVLASFFLPGLGSMINGEVGKGVGILIGYFVSWLLVIIIVGIVGVLAFWIWGMVDGYQGAQRWNARYGIIS